MALQVKAFKVRVARLESGHKQTDVIAQKAAAYDGLAWMLGRLSAVLPHVTTLTVFSACKLVVAS